MKSFSKSLTFQWRFSTLFKCKLQNYATCAVGFFTAWTVHTGRAAMGTASQHWQAARAATRAPPWWGCPVPVLTGSRKQPAFPSCIPLPWQTGWRARREQQRSLEDVAAGLHTRWGLHSAPLPTPVLSPKAALSPRAAHANSAGSSTCQLGTRVRTHTRSHARTQLAFSNMPDIAFLMLAQEIPVAAWSASFLIRGAGGQDPAPARGGWRGQTHRSWPLRLLSGPIICHFRPLLMSYLGCIFLVIAKQWQKPG